MVVSQFIRSQWLVFATDWRVRMSCTFNSSPVLATSQCNGIYSIHDSFVVRCCSILVLFSKLLCFNNLRGDFKTRCTFPSKFGNWNCELWKTHPFSAEIWQYLNSSPSLKKYFVNNVRSSKLSNGVDHIGAHWVSNVHQQLDYITILTKLSKPHIFNTSASKDHALAAQISIFNDAIFVDLKLVLSIFGVHKVKDLNLSNHHRWSWRASKPRPLLSNELGNGTACCNDRWFLNGHRHLVCLAIDDKSNPQAKRHRHDTNTILNHIVGSISSQSTLFHHFNVRFWEEFF